MATVQEVIIGGKGTICLGATKTLDDANAAAIYVREDAPNLQLFRERFEGETTDTEVTADHFDGTTPKAGDLIRGLGYNFKKIVVGAAGSVAVIKS
jgi:threonine dehydrogenase-like Zn-dependent dehydrogenase